MLKIDMIYIKLFEEFDKSNMTRHQKREYYKNLRRSLGPEERTYTIDKISDFDIPKEIINHMSSWSVIFKSPYSESFYNSTEVVDGYKPDRCFRVSDHWNYKIGQGISTHSKTDKPIKNTTHVSLGQYDASRDQYKILISLPRPSYLKKIEDINNRRISLIDPVMIALKKDFKQKIESKKIRVELIDNGKIYRGIVRKYTGKEIKIEDESGNLIYNQNYLRDQAITLFDKEGIINDPFAY